MSSLWICARHRDEGNLAEGARARAAAAAEVATMVAAVAAAQEVVEVVEVWMAAARGIEVWMAAARGQLTPGRRNHERK